MSWMQGPSAGQPCLSGQSKLNSKMQTSVISGAATSAAWLEYVPFHGAAPERLPLDSLPFTIGRDETADLRLDSTRVSREHAILDCVDGTFHVRDNGSTNGTFLNGEKIDSQQLHDGDMLVIADIELTFLCETPNRPQRSATTLIGHQDGDLSYRALVRELRQLQEAVTHCSVEIHYRPIADADSGAVVGFAAVPPEEEHPLPVGNEWHTVRAAECRLTERLHQVLRISAVKQAAGRLGQASLFVPVASFELGTPGLADSLGHLQGEWPNRRGLVVEIPDSTVTNTPQFRELLQRMRDLHVAVAYTEFASGPAEIAARDGWAPDYLKLARSWVTDIQQDTTRQRRLASIVRTCQEIGCEPVATGVDNIETMLACSAAGCRLAEGREVGTAQPIDIAEQASQGLLV